jgi:hypothetical protein
MASFRYFTKIFLLPPRMSSAPRTIERGCALVGVGGPGFLLLLLPGLQTTYGCGSGISYVHPRFHIVILYSHHFHDVLSVSPPFLHEILPLPHGAYCRPCRSTNPHGGLVGGPASRGWSAGIPRSLDMRSRPARGGTHGWTHGWTGRAGWNKLSRFSNVRVSVRSGGLPPPPFSPPYLSARTQTSPPPVRYDIS